MEEEEEEEESLQYMVNVAHVVGHMQMLAGDLCLPVYMYTFIY